MLAATRFSPVEVWEAKNRWKVVSQATRLAVPKGATLELCTGGGGGYGPPSERDPEAVQADLREGYVTEEHARRHHPHAFGSG